MKHSVCVCGCAEDVLIRLSTSRLQSLITKTTDRTLQNKHKSVRLATLGGAKQDMPPHITMHACTVIVVKNRSAITCNY